MKVQRSGGPCRCGQAKKAVLGWGWVSIQETFEREAETMAELPSHPHVVNMLEHFVLGNRVVIVTDW